MGTIRNGANGGFSGKAGSIIGSSWNNISYIKGLPKLSNKPASLKQLNQRARFAAVIAYLGPIKDILNVGYKGQTANRATGYNMGVQYAIANAITGDYPDYHIDRTLVQISKGTLSKPANVGLSATAGAINLTWNAQLNELTAFVDDKMLVLLYNAAQDFFLPFTNVANRGDGQVTLTVPDNFSGQTVDVYVFYTARDESRQSNSIYAGALTLP